MTEAHSGSEASPEGEKKPQGFEEAKYVRELIERIIEECPRRQATSNDERRAQMMMKEEFEQLGLPTREQPFRFNDNLYANLALHFGLGTLGSLVSGLFPLGGLALHSLAAGSYWADSTRRAYLLRRLFPFKPSQNILATLPAKNEPALRIVFNAHADAAFTGWIFEPSVISKFVHHLPPSLRFLRRSLALATQTQAALTGFDLLRLLLGPLTLPLRPLEALLSLPGTLAFLLNLQIVDRKSVV
jgi:hypothetical protein